MDIEKFLELKPTWAYQPCLYIVKQNIPNNNAFRCGLSGGMQFKDSDRVYGSDLTLSGLLSRMSMYMGFWTNGSRQPYGTIYAALRIKSQLVAKPGQRLGTDYLGNPTNINYGNQTLVRMREKDFHNILDSRKLRWDTGRKNELFVPGKKGVDELVACLRQVKGEEMYLFTDKGPIEDHFYRGGSNRGMTTTIDTFQRKMQPRDAALEARVPTVTFRMSRKGIEDLKNRAPETIAKLVEMLIPKTKKENKGAVPRVTRSQTKAAARAARLNEK